jgi:hypothetical protein
VPLLQSFQHPTLGLIEFTDKKQEHHSSPARAHDITITVALNDRSLTAEVKQMIIDDINRKEQANDPSYSNRR